MMIVRLKRRICTVLCGLPLLLHTEATVAAPAQNQVRSRSLRTFTGTGFQFDYPATITLDRDSPDHALLFGAGGQPLGQAMFPPPSEQPDHDKTIGRMRASAARQNNFFDVISTERANHPVGVIYTSKLQDFQNRWGGGTPTYDYVKTITVNGGQFIGFVYNSTEAAQAVFDVVLRTLKSTTPPVLTGKWNDGAGTNVSFAQRARSRNQTIDCRAQPRAAAGV